MKNRIVTAVFKDSAYTKSDNAWQWDYGQILRIQGLKLPTAVEVHFAVSGVSESITRIGTTKDGVTDVVIPDSLIETGKNLVAYVYLRDSESGNTEYQIDIVVSKRAKPEAYNTPDDPELFGKAIEAVNKAADRAEKAGQAATEAAGQAAEDAQQTAEDRKEVAKMVETVSDISEQVKKVEELSNKVQEAATKTGQDAQQTAEDRVEVGKMLETVKDVSEQVKSVEESVKKAKESEQAAAGHRTAVEEMKNSVEQTASTFPQKVQEGVQAIENAGTAAVQEITQAGTAQKTAVEGAGTQAVQSVENVKSSATEAVEAAKTTAVQAVQAEGTKQTGNVTAEGTKQVKAVQDKGAEVLQSIPEDFTTQMETKLDKQQGIENKGKALVIGEDGNVVPGEVSSGGGDGIAIINTMSGESPLVIPDSAERVNKGLELGGKTEQVQTTGKNLFDPNNNYEDLVWIRNDGEIVGGSNARTSDYIPVEQGNYAFQFDVINSNQMYVAGYNTDKQFVKIVGTTSKGKGTINIDDINIKTIRLSYTRDSTKIQLEFSANPTPYEPYTGGKPSPSQEYQQEVKNTGKLNADTQKYEVGVKVTGKNLFDYEKAKEKSNWTTSANGAGFVEFAVYVCAGSTVTVSNNTKINNPGLYYYGVALKSSEDFKYFICYPGYPNSKDTHTFTATEDYIYVRCNKTSLNDVIGVCGGLQIEIGASRTDFESYKEQTLTITSDRPLTKWDRLVEQGGQYGWLYGGDIKTFENDVFKLYADNEKAIQYQVPFEEISNSWSELVCYCNTFENAIGQTIYTQSGKTDFYMGHVHKSMVFSAKNKQGIFQSIEAFQEWIRNSGTYVWYKTDNKKFVPLSESEQNAIRALKTYYPTTVITADGGELDPDIKVTYTADTKNYIDGKVSANVASIISQYQLNTANLLSLMPMETQAAMIENDTNRILENVEEMKYE